MNSSTPLDALLYWLCAGSFATTCLLLLVSVFNRISFGLRTRLLRLIFSVGLTAMVIAVLAYAGGSASRRPQTITSESSVLPSGDLCATR